MHLINLQRQCGAALIVSLIILTVVTLLGVAGMQFSTLETKLSATARDRALAFEAAESAIKFAEGNLIASPPKRKKYFHTCDDDNNDCFNEGCKHGLCFKGAFSGENIKDCSIVNGADTYTQIGNTDSIWKDSTKIQSYNHVFYTDNNVAVKKDVAYVVEFSCFATRAQGNILQPTNREPNPQDFSPILKVIAQATGPAGKATVTLQTTIKIND